MWLRKCIIWPSSQYMELSYIFMVSFFRAGNNSSTRTVLHNVHNRNAIKHKKPIYDRFFFLNEMKEKQKVWRRTYSNKI